MIMAVIYPKHGEEGNVARTLLAMADDPMHVRTRTDEGLAFDVPDYLYERYLNQPAGEEDKPDALNEEQVRRRPGRPRKAQPVKEGD